MSRYGIRNGRRTGAPRMHAGVDIGAPRGAIIYTPRPGTVSLVSQDTARRGGGLYGYGNAVVIHHHDEGVYSFYAHMSSVQVRQGELLEAGQPIGVIGATTNGKFPGMGRHLHMEVRRPKEDGSSPFPGAYGRYNLDPAVWLAGHGIGFSREGMTADAAVEACRSPVPVDRQLEWLTPHSYGQSPRSTPSLFTRTSGLGDVAQRDMNADYEPPVPDPDFFKPVKPLIKALIPATLIGVGLVGVALTIED